MKDDSRTRMLRVALAILALAIPACGGASDEELEGDSEDVDTQESAVIANDHCSVKAYVPTHVSGSYTIGASGLGECDPGRSASITVRLQKYNSGWQTLGTWTTTISGPAKMYGVNFLFGTTNLHGTFRTQILAFGQTDNSPSKTF